MEVGEICKRWGISVGTPKGDETIKTLESIAAGSAGICVLAGWAQSSLCPFANSLLRSMFIRFIRFFLALMRFSLTTSRERHKPSYPKSSTTNRLLFSLKGKKKIKPKQKIEGKKRTSPRHKNISFAPVVQMELKTVKTEGLSPQLDHSGTM